MDVLVPRMFLDPASRPIWVEMFATGRATEEMWEMVDRWATGMRSRDIRKFRVPPADWSREEVVKIIVELAEQQGYRCAYTGTPLRNLEWLSVERPDERLSYTRNNRRPRFILVVKPMNTGGVGRDQNGVKLARGIHQMSADKVSDVRRLRSDPTWLVGHLQEHPRLVSEAQHFLDHVFLDDMDPDTTDPADLCPRSPCSRRIGRS